MTPETRGEGEEYYPAALAAGLPFPLQVPLEAALEVGPGLPLLVRILDVSEAAARFLVAVGAAAIEAGGGDPVPLPDAPDLGDWLRALEHVQAHHGDVTPQGLPEAARALLAYAAHPALSADLPVVGARSGRFPLAALRSWLHHAGGMTVRAATARCFVLAPLLLGALDACRGAFAPSELWAVPAPGGGPARLGRGADPAIDAPRLAGREPGVWLFAAGEVALRLWPVFRHEGLGLTPGAAPPGPPDPGAPVAGAPGDADQVFVRRQHGELRFSPLAPGAVYGRDVGGAALARHRSLFGRDERASTFEEELFAEAGRVVGREDALESVLDLLHMPRTQANRCLFLDGPAGGGKSALVAAVVGRLAEARLPFHVHLFKAGHQGCSYDAFCLLALELLGGSAPRDATPEERERLLADLLSDTDRLIVCDGLDELGRCDPAGLRSLGALTRQTGRWLLVGRPDDEVRRALDDARRVFRGGLPPLPAAALREIFLDRADPVVRHGVFSLTRGTSGQEADAVTNPYLDTVLDRADGHPLYLLVLLEHLAGLKSTAALQEELERIAVEPAHLPGDLDALYERIVCDWGVGDLATVAPEVLVALALSREPLGGEVLTELWAPQSHRDAEHRAADRRLTDRVLDRFRPFLDRAAGGGEPTYRVSHDRFRQYLCTDHRWQRTVRRMTGRLGEMAQRVSAGDLQVPVPDDPHFYRQGLAYLRRAALGEVADRFLGDFDYLWRRLGTLGPDGVDDLIADYRSSTDRRVRSWEQLLRSRAHVLRRNLPGWGPERSLHQLAFDAGDEVVRDAAHDWSATGGHGSPPLARVAGSLPEVDHMVAALNPHTMEVRGALELSSGRVLSWSKDHTLCVSDPGTGESLAVLEGHTGPVNGALELSSGRVLSWSKDHTLCVSDPGTGESLAVLEGHTGPVNGAIELSSGRILSWSADRTLRIWDPVTGEAHAVLEGHTDWISGALELAAGLLLSWSYWSGDQALRLWDPETGTVVAVWESHTGWVSGGALELSSGRVLSWSGDTLRVWDPGTGAALAVFPGHAERVGGALGLSSGLVLSWAGDTLRVWDPETGGARSVWKGHTSQVSGALELSSGRVLSWAGDTLRVWDQETGHVVDVSEDHAGPVGGALELSSGRVLSWAGDTLRVWDRGTGAVPALLEGHTSPVGGALELSSGRVVSWAGDGALRVWDPGTGAVPPATEDRTGPVGGALELSSGRVLSWAGDGTLRVFDPGTGDVVTVLQGGTGPAGGALELSSGRVLSWAGDGTLRVFDPGTGDVVTVLQGGTGPAGGALELSSGRVLSWAGDGTLRVFDPDTGDVVSVAKGHTGPVGGALELSSGRVLSWAGDTLRVWEPGTGEVVSVAEGHTGPVGGACELTSGRVLSWAGSTLRTWDPETGAALAVLQGHTGPIGGALELSSGRLLSWAGDRALRVWDPGTGDGFAVWEGHTAPVASALELSSGRVLTWAGDGTIRVWDPETGRCLATLPVPADGVVATSAGGREAGVLVSTKDGLLALDEELRVEAAWWSELRVQCALPLSTTEGVAVLCAELCFRCAQPAH